MRNYRANANEINKTPPFSRYVFITRYEDNTSKVAMSWRTLNEHLSRDSITEILVVDQTNHVALRLRASLKDELLDSWRENYLDKDWDIPFQFTV